MQDFELKNKTNRVYVAISTLSIHVTIGESQSDKSNIIVIEKSKEIYDKLKSYKSVSALVKYAKSHALPSPNTATDLLCEPVAVEGNPSCPAPAPAKSLERGIPVFISVKSTGHGHNDEIIDLAIVDIHEKILFHSVFKTKTQNRVFANAHLSDLPTKSKANFGYLWKKIEKIIKGRQLVAYHLPHFKKMIANSVRVNFQSEKNLTFEQILPDQKTIGLMYDYSKFYGDFAITGLLKNQSLDNACDQSDISLKGLKSAYYDRAFDDAVKTVRLYRFMQDKGLV